MIDQALEAIEISKKTIKQKDVYMVHLLSGKCFDRLRNFDTAINEYASALKSSEEQGMEDHIIGNMEFRLGWSMIRAKINIV